MRAQERGRKSREINIYLKRANLITYFNTDQNPGEGALITPIRPFHTGFMAFGVKIQLLFPDPIFKVSLHTQGRKD